MTRSSSVDATVIGAGVIGAACAYYLAKSGLKVALVEKGDVAAGCSGGCDGNIMAQDHQPGYDTSLTLASNKMFQEVLPERVHGARGEE